jgi:hypothetical protein
LDWQKRCLSLPQASSALTSSSGLPASKNQNEPVSGVSTIGVPTPLRPAKSCQLTDAMGGSYTQGFSFADGGAEMRFERGTANPWTRAM